MRNEIKNCSWMNDGLSVRETGKYGMGVYANKMIRKGEICAIFGGTIITQKQESQLPDDCRDAGIQISDEFVMSSLNRKEDTDYFNHSCDPNAGISGQIILLAMKNINVGEHVTFDYAMCSSYNRTSASFYSFRCECGSKTCRGTVTDDDWKLSNLQKKYKGYFSQYIQDKIDLAKKRNL